MRNDRMSNVANGSEPLPLAHRTLDIGHCSEPRTLKPRTLQPSSASPPPTRSLAYAGYSGD